SSGVVNPVPWSAGRPRAKSQAERPRRAAHSNSPKRRASAACKVGEASSAAGRSKGTVTVRGKGRVIGVSPLHGTVLPAPATLTGREHPRRTLQVPVPNLDRSTSGASPPEDSGMLQTIGLEVDRSNEGDILNAIEI